jgi:hypothetical protein
MEKKSPITPSTELDKLIDLLDNPEQLRLRINYLKNSTYPLTDEVEGFLSYYEIYKGDTTIIKEKLEQLELKTVGKFIAPTKKWDTLKWVASIALIIGSGIALYVSLSENNSMKITPYVEIGIPNYMGPSTTSSIDWKNIMLHYKTNNFQKITALVNKKNNDTLAYFQGIAWFKQKKFQKGIQSFEKIPLKSIYCNKGYYFKALCYYKLNQNTKAKEVLKYSHLDNHDPNFNQKVKELKEKL